MDWLSFFLDFLLIVFLVVWNLLLFLRSQGFEELSDVRFLFNLIFNYFLLDYLLGYSHFVLNISLDVESKVAIRHHLDANCVFSLLLLAIGHLEGFGRLVKSEEFVEEDHWRLGIADDYVPSLHFEEGIGGRTAEIACSVGFYCDYELEEITCSDVILIINFELVLQLQSRVIFKALLDVCCSVGI